jgi:hypothetical protein
MGSAISKKKRSFGRAGRHALSNFLNAISRMLSAQNARARTPLDLLSSLQHHRRQAMNGHQGSGLWPSLCARARVFAIGTCRPGTGSGGAPQGGAGSEINAQQLLSFRFIAEECRLMLWKLPRRP